MSGAGRIPSGSHFRGRVSSRLWLALAASSALHIVLAAILASERPGLGTPGPGAVPIRARLAPLPLVISDSAMNERVAAPPEARAAPVSEATTRQISPSAATGAVQGAGLPPGAPQVPDETVYSARELDVYPVPVAPLDVDRLASRAGVGAAREVRMELVIDEYGRVDEISLGAPRTAGSFAAQLRDAIAATRFTPARKEGRAVKSRVVLSVSLGAEEPDP